MINKIRKFDVNYSSYVEEQNYGIYLDVTKQIIVGIKKTVNKDGLMHQITFSESEDSELFFVNVDNSIKFCALITNYEKVKSESVINVAKLIRDYDITDKELQEINNSEPYILKDPEPRLYTYKCQVQLSVLDAIPDKWVLANKILEEIIL